MRTSLCWIRRDVRLHDHRALAVATSEFDRVVVVFSYDTRILEELPDRNDRRVTFLHASLEEVAQRLRERGSALVALHGDPVEEIPRLAAKVNAEAVLCNHDDEPYALERDAEVSKRLASDGREFRTFKDHVVFERLEVAKQDGTPYTVYTPYARAWFERLSPEDVCEQEPDLARLAPASSLPSDIPLGNRTLGEVAFRAEPLWLEPGTAGGQRRLNAFMGLVHRYHEQRDLYGVEGTSGLSVHLRHGTVSIRECLRAVLAESGPGPTKWSRELVWREFYHSILANFPHVATGAFRREYAGLAWPGGDREFEAWAAGQTGYPVVDAAMRCLRATGWMHNRLRMVTAMFLTKDLLVDWRRGEAHFARYLLDFDLANNNGGWQWSASTGVDAQPYFRIFNPVLQSKKFDPSGQFIRQWVPELASQEGDSAHWPHGEGLLSGLASYPPPIVDHGEQRAKAVKLLSFELSSKTV